MAKHLNDKVGSMEYDKLIAGITPPVKVPPASSPSCPQPPPIRGAPSCAAAPAPAATAS